MISMRHSARLSPDDASTASRRRGVRLRPGPRRRSGSPPEWTRWLGGSPEWTLEEMLKRNSSALTFLGITLGVFVSRRFFALPLAVAAMLVQDSVGTAGLARVRRAVRR